MSKHQDSRRLDVKGFAQAGEQLHASMALAGIARLMAETQGRGGDAIMTWSARGELRNARHVNPQIWLHLQASATLSLTCQRCLAPVAVPVAVDRSFRFASDEDTAAAQDDESEEDVLALSRSFDLQELVEDEILLEMPMAPRHEVCPSQLPMSVADEEFEQALASRESPFAMLDKLKKTPS